jgi:(R,R)-butanediol dehydrogenase/meso-butanediol dehydrogenase/diacetyl reductase
MAVESARKGGKIVVLGVFHEDVALDYRHILMSEKQIMGSIIYQRQDFADAIAILGTGILDMACHVTAEVALRDIVTGGFVPLSESKAEHIKTQVMP